MVEPNNPEASIGQTAANSQPSVPNPTQPLDMRAILRFNQMAWYSQFRQIQVPVFCNHSKCRQRSTSSSNPRFQQMQMPGFCASSKHRKRLIPNLYHPFQPFLVPFFYKYPHPNFTIPGKKLEQQTEESANDGKDVVQNSNQKNEENESEAKSAFANRGFLPYWQHKQFRDSQLVSPKKSEIKEFSTQDQEMHQQEKSAILDNVQ